MREVTKQLILPYSKQQVFNLVTAIEDYPEFLPWCQQAEVHYRTDSEVKATLNIAKGPIKFNFTTLNIIKTNNATKHIDQIQLKLVQGPFRNLDGDWSFEELVDGKCLVKLRLAFQFSNKLMAMALEPFFLTISSTLLSSFMQRAQKLYG